MHRKKINIAIYETELFIVLCDDIAKASKKFKFGLSPQESASATGFTVETADAVYVVINVPKHKSIFSLANTIAHEARHAADYVMDSINHPLDVVHAEPHTWLTGYITEVTLKFYANLVDKGKVKRFELYAN
jgi:hypothetical protein